MIVMPERIIIIAVVEVGLHFMQKDSIIVAEVEKSGPHPRKHRCVRAFIVSYIQNYAHMHVHQTVHLFKKISAFTRRDFEICSFDAR